MALALPGGAEDVKKAMNTASTTIALMAAWNNKVNVNPTSRGVSYAEVLGLCSVEDLVEVLEDLCRTR